MITDDELTLAVSEFWNARLGGTQSGKHDKAFLNLLAREFTELGLSPHVAISVNDANALVSGYFRAAKTWDIVCRLPDGQPIMCVEFKSQVDSYGNNENNRYEEAIGSGLDARALHGSSIALGFFLVLCEEEQTTRATRDRAPGLDPAFSRTSHVQRREIFARRIIEFRVNEMPFYDAAAVLLVHRDGSFRILEDSDLDPRTFPARLAVAIPSS